MSGIAATYISATSFYVPGDMTGEFVAYRRVRGFCGVDGYIYGCVSSSVYSGETGYTTVTLIESVITSNLASVMFGVVAPGSAGALPEKYIAGISSDAKSIMGVPVDDTDIADDTVLSYDALSETLKYRSASAVPADIEVLDSQGEARGANSINLQPGRTSDALVAAGTGSIAVGHSAYSATVMGVAVGMYAGATQSGFATTAYPQVALGPYAKSLVPGGVAVGLSAEAGYTNIADSIGSVAVGAFAEAKNSGSVAIGHRATAPYGAVAIGAGAGSYGVDVRNGPYGTYNGPYGVCVGHLSKSHPDGDGVAVGAATMAGSDGGLAVGRSAQALNAEAIALGAYALAYSAQSIALGRGAKTYVPNTCTISAGIMTRRSYHEIKGASLWKSFAAAEVTIMTVGIDVTDTANLSTRTIDIPPGATFYPNEVGIIVSSADTVTAQPTLKFGADSDDDALTAAAATDGLVADADRERRITLLIDSGVTSLSVTLTAVATATEMVVRCYFQGLLVEDEDNTAGTVPPVV